MSVLGGVAMGRDRRFAVECLEGRALLTVTFDRLVYTAGPADTRAAVTLNRFRAGGDLSGSETVELAPAAGGTAAAGADYPAFRQAVTFLDGEATKTVDVPVLAAPAGRGTRTLALALTPVTPGSVDPAGSAATLSIAHGGDATPPRVTGAYAATRGGRVTGFVLTFSEDMAPAAVRDVRNYAIADPASYQGAASAESVKPKTIPLKSAVYHAATRTVTLTPSRAVRAFPLFVITSRQWLAAAARGTAAAPSPITDRAGNPLDGAGSGRPDGLLLVQAPARAASRRS